MEFLFLHLVVDVFRGYLLLALEKGLHVIKHTFNIMLYFSGFLGPPDYDNCRKVGFVFKLLTAIEGLYLIDHLSARLVVVGLLELNDLAV